MASSTAAILCITCNKKVSVATCDGCQKRYCRPHFNEHHQELVQWMENITQDRNKLKEEIDGDCNDHPLMSQIDQWEGEAIVTIRAVAWRARAEIKQCIEKNKDTLEKKVEDLTEELKRRRDDDDYAEKELERWEKRLQDLRDNFKKPSGIKLEEDRQKSPLYMIKVKQQGMSISEISDKILSIMIESECIIT